MRKILALLLLLSVLRVNAQTPVQVNAQLLPPYSLQVSDYYSPSASAGNKINLILLNRDFVRTTVKVRLRMTIESQGIRISTKENVTYPEITLTAGSPYYVAPSELSAYFNAANLDFSGITPEQYTVMGKLPENFYTFCFEAIETTTGLTVSNKGCAFAWMTLSDPPFLNIPAKAETITPNTPQNIVFQWTPRHTASPNAGYNTDYVFSITEVQAGDFNPEAAFTSHQPLYVDSVQATSFNYGPDKPQLITGKKYAWRVQAKAKQGLDNLAMFRNNGYSEVFWFDYKNNCVAPSGITATVQGTRVIIEWQPLPIYLYYKVDYREKNNPSAEWFSISNTNPRVVITDLNFGKEYEYRVGAACEEDSYNYSTIRSFTTGSEPVPPVANCGDSSNIPLSVQQNYLTTMVPGDSIIAGDFKVVVTQVSGSTNFTGEGYVKVPWLLGIKVGVKFNGIKVNTDRKLAYGKIETTYDPSENGITDIDEYIDIFTAGYGVGGVVTGQVTADTVFTFTIQWPGGISATLPPGYNPATGQGPVTISIIPVGGGSTVTYTVDHLPTTIQDAAGNVYQVNQDGSVTLVGHQGGATMLTKTNKKLIDADKALVKFVTYNNSKVQYAFDEWQPIYKKSLTINKEYEKISCEGGVEGIDGGNYYVSAKAIAPGKTDYIKAVVTVSDNSIVPDSIQFVNGKGTIYNRTRIDSAAGGYTYEIAVVGGPEKDAQEIYALYPRTGSKTFNFGKVLVASYPEQNKKLVLVPVKGAAINKDSVALRLNKIYGGINVFWTVKLDANFDYDGWDLNHDNKLAVSENDFLSSFTDEMKRLNSTYSSSRRVDSDAVYLFVLNESSVSSGNVQVVGDMPKGKQFGYLFTGNNNLLSSPVTAAHEVGHGLFHLKHLEDYKDLYQGVTSLSNLMDYPSGNNLLKMQWDYVHDPAFVSGFFQKEEDNQNQIVVINKTFLNPDNTTVSFLSQTGSVISIAYDNLQSVEFSYGSVSAPNQNAAQGLSYQFSTAEGPVRAFVLKNDNTLTKYKFNETTKSYRNEASGTDYVDATNYTNVDGVIFPMPCGENYTLYKFAKGDLPKFNSSIGEILDFSTLAAAFKPFAANAKILKEGEVVKQVVSNQIYENCLWCRSNTTANMTQNSCETPELYYIDKAAQLRVIFPEYFSQFTQLDENWAKPVTQISASGGTGGGGFSSTADTTWFWGKYLYLNPQLATNYTNHTELAQYYYQFCYQFRNFVDTAIVHSAQFWANLDANTSAATIVSYLAGEPAFQTSKAPFEKRKLAVKILTANSLPESKEEAVIKILAVTSPEEQASMLTYLASEIKIKKIFSKFDDSHLWYGEDNYTKVVTLLSGFIQNPVFNQNAFILAADTVSPKFISIDQDIIDNRQTSYFDISDDNKITFIDFNNGTIFSQIPYNEMVPVQFWTDFDLGERTFHRKEIVPVPAMFAALLVDKGGKALFAKKAWLAFDAIMMTVGVGELKVAWNAASWIRKAMLVSNMVGTTVGIINEIAPESYIPESTKKKIRIGCLLLQTPELIRGLGQIKKSLSSKADEAERYAADLSVSERSRLSLNKFSGLIRADVEFAEDAAELSSRVVTLGADVDRAKQWLGAIGAADNKIYIVAHAEGSSFSVLRRSVTGATDEVVLGHRSLAKWIQGKNFDPAQDIVLLSCSDIQSAQNLSNKLGRKIIASDGAVSIHNDGGIVSDKPFLELRPNTASQAFGGTFPAPSANSLKITLRTGWKSFIDDLSDWDQALKDALDASISNSNDLKNLFTNAADKEELANAWRALRNSVQDVSAANALYKNPLALQAFVKLKANPKFAELGLTDLILSRIRGFGNTTTSMSYDKILSDIDNFGYFLNSHPGTTTENFDQLLSILQSNNDNYKQGITWIIENVQTDASTFAGKKLDFEYRVTNMGGNNAYVDLRVSGVPPKYIEFKSGPGSVTKSTIIDQFIKRDLVIADLTSINQLECRIINSGVTKNDIFNWMCSTQGKTAFEGILNGTNEIAKANVINFFNLSSTATTISNAKIASFLDSHFSTIFKIYQ